MTLTRKQLSEALTRHRGAAAEICRKLGIKPCSLSNWKTGRSDSRRIEAEVLAFLHRAQSSQQGSQR